jgi:hypothetical protein
MASALVKVNGQECGALRWQPFVVDISDAANIGKNKIEIEMATTLVNAFGPSRMAGIKDSHWVGPQEFVNMNAFKDNYELFGFGLESIALFEMLN